MGDVFCTRMKSQTLFQPVELLPDLSDDNKDIIRDLCQRIYMLESSLSHVSSQQTIADIKGEITLRSDSFIEPII